MEQCAFCGSYINQARVDIGYKTCMPCGEQQARAKKFTVVPMHKSNYVPMFNTQDLKGINNKGGLVR